jgi:hypothetical protein
MFLHGTPCASTGRIDRNQMSMKVIVLTGFMVSLAVAVSYASWAVNTMSEASLLMLWGGVLLTIARGARGRAHEPASEVLVSRSMPDLHSTGSIRLQPGL